MTNEKKIIVVVDDNPQDLELMTRYLRQLGFCPKAFPCGNQGLDYLVKQDELPYMTLCDIRMDAGIDGFEFARKFRQIKGGDYVALLAFTGYVSDHVMRKCQSSGFDGCIPKPPNAATLGQQLRMYVRP